MKVIAIGNRLMRDDAIALSVEEKIEEELKKHRIELIFGETDFIYCISNIKEEDFIVILDSSFYGVEPGEITITSINSSKKNTKSYTQHSFSIVDLIRLHYPKIKGYIITIEIAEIEMSLGISETLNEELDTISKKVLEEILKLKSLS